MSAHRIAVDIRMWAHPGIGRYTRELVDAMTAERGFGDFHFLGYEKDLSTFLRHASGASSAPVTSRIYSLAEQFEMKTASDGRALLHVPHFNIPFRRKGKLVVTIHDLIYLQDASASKSPLGRPYAEFLFKQVCRKAAAILTVSEHTRRELLERFPKLSPEKVFVTHEAASPLFRPIDDPEVKARMRKKYAIRKPFILYVGSLKAHKNIPTLVDAVKELRHRKVDVDLILVGRRDMKNHELWRYLQLNSSYARCVGELPDEDLTVFYNMAVAFCLPSFREGFGLPVLEAMACGTPAVVSDRASLPEIAGAAALLFNPERVDALVNHLHGILTDDKLRTRLIAAGEERAKEFSWKKTAQKTLEAYDRVLA